MSKWALAGLLAAAGTAWLAPPRPNGQDDDRRPPSAPLIKLNVAAVDARGQSVADLTREDFQVFDGSKLQPIASFRRNDIKPLHALPHGPNEVSNRSGTPLSRATVILFDLLNARFDDRAYVANQLVPALQHVEASDSLFLYILTIDGTLYPVHPLPDPETTVRTTARPWTEDIKPLVDRASHKLFGVRPPGLTVDDRVRMTYVALEALAARVAETPGRKSIIWISHGVPISIGGRSGVDEIDYTPLLRRRTPHPRTPCGVRRSPRWPGLRYCRYPRRHRPAGQRRAHELPEGLRSTTGQVGWQVSQDPRDVLPQGRPAQDQRRLLCVRRGRPPWRPGESRV